MNLKNLTNVFAGSLAVVLLSGCTTTGRVPLDDEPRLNAPEVNYRRAPRAAMSEGSLWSGNDDHWSLFTDDRAKRPGDLVFVNIVDVSEGESNTEGAVDRKMDINAAITNFFGEESNFGTGRNATGDRQDVDLNNLITAASDLGFESEGELKRDHKVIAQISAQVIDVTQGGNLMIHGYKVTKVGKEYNYITVSGMVRPSDLTFDNVIESTRIANADIDYSARGPYSGDIQSPGWLARTFSIIWPF